MDVTDLFITTADKAAAQAVERRWLNWLRDPDHNAAPNAKANAAAAQREFKSAGGDWRAEHAERVRRILAAPVRWGQGNPTLAEPSAVLGNTMAHRAQAQMKAILREREQDPEPTWADAIGRAYWARREEKRRAEMSHWRAYLP